MKTCTICGKEKDLSEFPYRNKSKGLFHAQCKKCKNVHSHNHYTKNKEKYYKNQRKWLAQRRNEINNLYCQYLLDHPCVDCGEDDILVLEPDHLYDKKYKITAMVKGGHAWDAILKELSKCEIVCANCHRRRTYKRHDANYRIDFIFRRQGKVCAEDSIHSEEAQDTSLSEAIGS